MRRAWGRGEDGQVATAFVLIGLAVMLVLVLKYMTPLAQAGDHYSQGQTAAEAAALAGAKAIADDTIPSLIASITDPDQWPGITGDLTSSMGSGPAAQLASENNTSLISYSYDWRRDRVTATVRPQSTAQGTIKPVSAVARIGFDWTCSWAGLPTDSPSSSSPPPTGSPTGSPTTPPPPPPDSTVQLVCGSFSISFVLSGRTGHLRLSPAGQLDGLLRPRLIG